MAEHGSIHKRKSNDCVLVARSAYFCWLIVETSLFVSFGDTRSDILAELLDILLIVREIRFRDIRCGSLTFSYHAERLVVAVGYSGRLST
jgi:hypothetical protein